jgi:hypothetical protein
MRRWVGVAACGVLISCGGGGGSSSAGGAGGAAKGGSGGSGAAGAGGSTADGGGGSAASGTGGSSGGSSGAAGAITLRVVNIFRPSGSTTGPALDIYDDMYDAGLQPSLSGKPIIAGLAYGMMSDYVRPHFVEGGGTAVELTALPAGSPSDDTTDAQAFYYASDDGSHPQVTVVVRMETGVGAGPLASLEYDTFLEKGDETKPGLTTPLSTGPLAPPPPAGQGEYLVNLNAINDFDFSYPEGGYFFFVDDACAPPLNGNPNLPGVPFVNAAGSTAPDDFSQFVASPGSHSISIVAWRDPTTPTCADLLGARQAPTTVSVAAGQQIVTFIYGSSLTDLHLLTGLIAP